MTCRSGWLGLFIPGAVVALGWGVAAASPRQKADTPPAAKQADTPVVVRITGEVAHPLDLTAEAIAKFERTTVEAKNHQGVESRYGGVRLNEILARAGVPFGKELRGPAMAFYLVVEAADGYRAVFALSELDPAFTDRVIVLADHRDDQPLSAREGPYQIVVPGEKKHARWVRQVLRLRIGRA